MAALAARDVEDPRAGRQAKHIDQPADLSAVAREVEDRAVLEQVVRVEVLRPPVACRAGTGWRPPEAGRREPGTEPSWSLCSLFPVPCSRSASAPQKKTGSLYAPNTASIAARVSYSVQYARAHSRI